MLLAAARPGQRTPGLGQAVNLAACGLVIRVRRIPGWLAADAGQDALAVVSLIAPAVVFILLALGRGAMDATAAARVPFWPLLPFPPSLGESVVVMIAWLAVVLLGLTGRRGAAAVIASISLTLAWLAVLTVERAAERVPARRASPVPGPADVPVVLASLAACSLALSPGPRRGLAIVGWRRACLMIAGLSAGFGFPSIVQLVHPGRAGGRSCLPPAGRPGDRARGSRHARTRPRGPAGRGAGSGRAPAQSRRHSWASAWRPCLVTLLVILLVAVLVWPVAIVSWLGRVRRASRAG